MKSDLLFDAIGELPDEYVQDARPATIIKRKVPWGVWAAAAACLVIAVLVAVPLLNGGVDSADAMRNMEVTNEIVHAPESVIAEGAMESEAEAEEGKGSEAAGSATNVYGDGTDIAADPTGSENLIGETDHHFDNYEDFAEYAQDSVFEAFVATELAQQRDITFMAKGFDFDDDGFRLTSISMGFDADVVDVGKTAIMSANPTITRYYDDLMIDGYFPSAKEEGVLTEYKIDGIEIQKYESSELFAAFGDTEWDPNDLLFCERVHIGDAWYHVEGTNEAKVDDIAAELARIANEL